MKAEDLPQRLIKWLLPRNMRRKVNLWYKFQRADYFVVSYPKCGRTWLRVMLSNYYIERYSLKSGSVLDFANLHYQNRSIPKIFFSHGIPHTVIRSEDISTDKSEYYGRNVIYLTRDPRDVIVSDYFQRTRRDKNYNGSLSEFIFDPVGGLDTLIGFYNVWAESLPHIDNKLVIKYEDMRIDTENVVVRLLEFMGHAPDRSMIHNAVVSSSFGRMKNMERTGAYNRIWLQAGDVKDEESFKVRSGKIGGYTEYLAGENLDRINAIIRDKLSPVFGY